MPSSPRRAKRRSSPVTDSARDVRCRDIRWTGSTHVSYTSENIPEMHIPNAATMASLQHVLNERKRKPNRLIPFQPTGPTTIYTLADARRRQNAIDSLKVAANSGEKGSYYYCTTLQSELLDVPLRVQTASDDKPKLETHPAPLLFKYDDPSMDDAHRQDTQQSGVIDPNAFALHPLERGNLAQALGWSSHAMEPRRQFATTPFKILDAPDLHDDFYYNLIHWSSKNVLAVGLAKAVYLWTASTSVVEELNSSESVKDEISSLCWSQGSSALAVGTTRGSLQLWDPEAKRKLLSFHNHGSRVGSLSWNIDMLASGCRDGIIRCFDHRTSTPVVALRSHQSEVCGIQWSQDNLHLISGGNDNRVKVWDIRKPQTPLWKITEHKAAVKALAWSPHNSKYFASGGGLKDLTIKIWNLCTLECVHDVDTGAQVCGLHWSENVNEIVSTHGYNSNSIKIWRGRNMQNLATIPGHSKRIVYMTVSPDGTSIATGAGDESIRFFFLFPPAGHSLHPEQARRNMIHDHVR